MGGVCRRSDEDLTPQYCKSAFAFIRIIGKGGFGRVWKVSQKKTKHLYAMKVMDKAKVVTKKSVNSIMNERQVLAHLLIDNCQFLVNMKCAFQDRENLYLLMDYLDGGDLRSYINCHYTFNEEQIKFIVRCLVEGLNHIHSLNIIHRDIKPENIILDKAGYARITDLGIARYWKLQNSTETSGTPGYMAPEVLLRQNHSFSTDFYAVGIIAYEMLVGQRPYRGRDRKSVREQMLGREVKIPKHSLSRISVNGAAFINKLVQRTPKKRLGVNGISELLKHPWLEMNSNEHELFMKRKLKSPIVSLQFQPGDVAFKPTLPDQIYRENQLLLKRPEMQKMFENYDYTPVNLNSPSVKKTDKLTSSLSTVSSAILNRIMN